MRRNLGVAVTQVPGVSGRNPSTGCDRLTTENRSQSAILECPTLDHHVRDAEPHPMNRGERPAAALVEALASEIHGVLGDDLVGLYVYGSAVSGGFDPGVSDIDLVAVTSRDVEALDLAGLDRMQHDFVGRHPDWSDDLEIVYVGRDTLASFRTGSGSLAVIGPGEPLHVREDRVADWLQNWYLVRETGVCLSGPDAATLVPQIAWTEFVAATVRYADEVRHRSRVGAGASSLAYAILTLCRALHVLRTQTNASKQQAAAWTRERLPEWGWLIDAALDCRLARGAIGFEDERSRTGAERLIALLADEILEGNADQL